jgi:hypothetical protein
LETCLRCREQVEYIKEGNDFVCPKCGWEVEAAKKFDQKYRSGSNKRKALDKSIYNVVLGEDSFHYNDNTYRYADIDYIRSVTLPMTFYFKIIPAGRQQSAILTIRFQNGKKVKIREEGDKTSIPPQPQPSNDRVRYLHSIYVSLSKKSLPFRLAKYFEEYKRKGSFAVEKVQFRKDRTLQHRNRLYDLDACTISRVAQTVRLDSPKSTASADGRRYIEITHHGDVTAELLKVLFGLDCKVMSS